MKSAYYAAAVTNAYRHAIDCALDGKALPQIWRDEVDKLSHRPYCTGFYYGDPGQHYSETSYYSDAEVCAVVEECDADGNAVLTQKKPILPWRYGRAMTTIMSLRRLRSSIWKTATEIR